MLKDKINKKKFKKKKKRKKKQNIMNRQVQS